MGEERVDKNLDITGPMIRESDAIDEKTSGQQFDSTDDWPLSSSTYPLISEEYTAFPYQLNLAEIVDFEQPKILYVKP